MERKIPSDIQQLLIITRYEIVKHLRSKRLLGMMAIELAIFVLILAIPPLLGGGFPDNGAEFAERFYTWTKILLIIGATFFAGDAIVSEFQNRTGYLTFPNPVKRWVLFMGKLTATMGIMVAVVLVYYGLVSASSLAIVGEVSGLTAISLGLALLFAICASGIGYVVSAFMKGSTGSLVLTFTLLFLLFPIVEGVLSIAKVRPDFSPTFSADAIQYVMQDPYPPHSTVIPTPQGEFIQYIPYVDIAVVVMIVYAVASIVLGILLFNRKEMAA
ncbi:MAG: ABC transporter permease [Methanomassiliicoccales archaeon]